ncbi:MAG: hypothetical protein LBS83_02075 [Holosporales bacterium]|nr:hypothetical protein [Holosporales bacterium]
MKDFFLQLKTCIINLISNKSKIDDFFSISQGITFSIDCIISFFSLCITTFIFDTNFFEYSSGFLIKNMFVFFLTSTGTFIVFKTYITAPGKNAKEETPYLFLALTLSTLIFYPLMFLLGQLESFSISTPVLNLFICTILLYFSRKALISAKSLSIFEFFAKTNREVLIIGNSDEVRIFLKNNKTVFLKRFNNVIIIANDWRDSNTEFNLDDLYFLISKNNIIRKNHLQSDFKESDEAFIEGIPIIGGVNLIEKLLETNFFISKLETVFLIGNSLDPLLFSKIQYFCNIHKKDIIHTLDMSTIKSYKKFSKISSY